MPYRAYSESGFYHVVQKGAGGQLLFSSDRDRQKYLLIMQDELEKFDCTLIAWCLMSNHTHLLVRAERDELSRFMGLIGMRYSRHFNHVEGHIGPVFQGRFFSEPVKSDEHLLSAVRYIHNNPQKAMICPADKYPWSSYREYTLGAQMINPQLMLGMLGGIAAFKRFSFQSDDFDSKIFDGTRVPALSDEDALTIAKEAIRPYAPTQLKSLPRSERDAYLRALQAGGIGISQASRITGLGKSTVHRAYHA